VVATQCSKGGMRLQAPQRQSQRAGERAVERAGAGVPAASHQPTGRAVRGLNPKPCCGSSTNWPSCEGLPLWRLRENKQRGTARMTLTMILGTCLAWGCNNACANLAEVAFGHTLIFASRFAGWGSMGKGVGC